MNSPAVTLLKPLDPVPVQVVAVPDIVQVSPVSFKAAIVPPDRTVTAVEFVSVFAGLETTVTLSSVQAFARSNICDTPSTD